MSKKELFNFKVDKDKLTKAEEELQKMIQEQDTQLLALEKEYNKKRYEMLQKFGNDRKRLIETKITQAITKEYSANDYKYKVVDKWKG